MCIQIQTITNISPIKEYVIAIKFKVLKQVSTCYVGLLIRMSELTKNARLSRFLFIQNSHFDEWFKDNGISLMEQPVCSPDLKPIEYAWDAQERRISSHAIPCIIVLPLIA